MKKFITIGLMLFAMACKTGTTTQTPSDSTKLTPSMVAKKDSIKLDFEIDSTTARSYVSNYDSYAGISVDSTGKSSGNTRTIWISLKRLHYMVAKLDSEKATKNTDGLRIYLCRYPKKEVNGYADHNTLVFVSTREVKLSKDSVQHLDYYTKGKHIPFISPENKGEICPPPANCCNTGALLLCRPSSPKK